MNLLETKLKKSAKDNTLPKIVVPVHLAGQSPNMKKIHELSKEFGFNIVEDASHSIGGKYLDEYVGNCKYSDITVFSFHPVKIITSGEGGMALTNDEELRRNLFIEVMELLVLLIICKKLLVMNLELPPNISWLQL